MAILKSQCPGCKKILKLKTKAALGKRVPCPQCNNPFIVEEYESPEMVDDFIDDDEGETFDYAEYEEASGGASADGYDDYEDDYGDDDYGDDDYDEAPRRKSSTTSSKSGGQSKSRKSKKKKKSAGMPAWLPMALMAGAGVAALAGIVGAIVAFMPSGGNQIDLAWLPEDADIYVQVKPQEMWNSKVLQPIREIPMLKQALDQAQAGAGKLPVEASDVSMISVAVTGIQETSNPFQGMQGGRGQEKTLAVVRLSKAVQAADFEKLPGVVKSDHNGTAYFTVNGQAMFIADDKTIVAGEPSLVTAAIDRGPTEPRVSRLDFINPDHQLVMVVSPHALTKPKEGGSNQIEAAFNENARAVYFGLSLTSSIDLEVGVDCFGSDEAASLKAKLDTALSDAKLKMDAQAGQVPDQMKSFVDISKKTVNSISASTSGSQLTVSASVPGEISTTIAELANNPFAAMALGGLVGQMGQGFGGLGGGNPGMATPPPNFGGTPGTTPGQNTGTTNPSVGGSSNPLLAARDAARRTQSKNNLKQIILAVHNYHETHNRFPQSATVGPDGKTTHSWRVAILPFVDQTALYNEYKLDEPWDSPANQAVMKKMPAIFRNPNESAGSTNASYFGLVGPDTAMGDSSQPSRIRDVVDGTANTIFVVEAKRNIPWTKPEDISYAIGSAVPPLGGFHTGGFNAATCDGQVRFIAGSIDQNTLRNLINRRDGNVVGQF